MKRIVAVVVAGIIGVSVGYAAEPILEFKLNVPELIKTVEQIVPKEAQADPAFIAQMASVRALKISYSYLFLYPDSDFNTLPVLMVSSTDPMALKNLFVKDGLLSAYFDQITPSQYKIKSEFLTDEALAGLPLDKYRVWLGRKFLLFAPISIVESWQAGATRPMGSRVVKTAATLQSQKHVFTCAVQIKENIKTTDWKKVSSKLPIPSGSESGMVTGVGVDLISEMSDAFSTIESFAFGFHLGDNKQRVIEYTQRFRNTANVAGLYKQITQGKAGGDEPTNLMEVLARFITSDSVKMVPALNGKSLSLQLSWKPEADQQVMESIGGYLMGKVMGAAMGDMDGMGNMGDMDGTMTIEINDESSDL
jgi:hypothetical protein